MNKEFDEIEPRVTPQPIPLKCITAPSVPEVSLIFGKSLDETDGKNKSNQDTVGEKYETYDLWKKKGFRESPGYNLNSKHLANGSQNFITVSPKSILSKSASKSEYRDILHSEKLLAKQGTIIYENGQNIVIGKQFSEITTRKNGESIVFPNKVSDNNTNCSLQNQAKYSSYPSKTVGKLYNQTEINKNHDAVKDLIKLVQNQNEQIKVLQNQVEKLLQTHELGNCSNVMKISCERTQINENNGKNSKNPTQNFRQHGTKIIPPCQSNESSEKRLQNDCDQFRKTVMEQQVSIGVMTSFEFSLHKNAHQSESEHEMNVVPKDGGRNVTESEEIWCQNLHCSRKICVEPLENINEDSESHLSSICKQNGSSNPMNENTSSKITGNGKDRSESNFTKANEYNERIKIDSEDRQLNYERNESVDPKNVSKDQDTRIKSSENSDDFSFLMRTSELRLLDELPSPDPSIHVEIQEYSSDDDDEKSKRVPPIGWTFYKNVVGQVNKLLHTIPNPVNSGVEEMKKNNPVAYKKVDKNHEILDTLKLTTKERLQMLGISYAEYSEINGEKMHKKFTFDSSYCPRFNYEQKMPQNGSILTENNTSVHMKALALKYLSDDQLADLAVQKQGDGSLITKHVNNVHGTNISLATMNYLQRYRLNAGINPYVEGQEHLGNLRQKKLKHMVMTQEFLTQSPIRNQIFNEPTTPETPYNILDITSLKQQPKLL